MYRIMLVATNKSTAEKTRTYKYYLLEDETIFETDDLTKLDAKVEELLLTYGKNDFVVVKLVDYNVTADIATATE